MIDFQSIEVMFHKRNLTQYVLSMGPFKYYVIKEVGGWGQKMAIFDDKKVKNMMT